MPIYQGTSNKNQQEIMVENHFLERVYRGDVLVWQKYRGRFGALYNWYAYMGYTDFNFGNLYNWYAITDPRNMAPLGFHVPTDSEWETLVNTLGGQAVAGDKLKEAGNDHWLSSNQGTNSSGFTARGAGNRNNQIGTGNYNATKATAIYWSITESSEWAAWCRKLYAGQPYMERVSGVKDAGFSLRFVKDDSTFTASVRGNDLKFYDCVQIGNQVWTVQNSMETRFRNGQYIPLVQDPQAWINLLTPGYCPPEGNPPLAGTDYNLAPEGWHVALGFMGYNQPFDFLTLRQYLDPSGTFATNTAGGKLKTTNLNEWNAPNTGADNSAGFNGQGGGMRTYLGFFSSIKFSGSFWAESVFSNANDKSVATLNYNSATLNCPTYNSGTSMGHKVMGLSVRLVKNSSDWTPGETITDVDGNVYPTVKIGTQVWVAANWNCTRFANGTPIANPIPNEEWAAASFPAYCYYNNNPAYGGVIVNPGSLTLTVNQGLITGLPSNLTLTVNQGYINPNPPSDSLLTLTVNQGLIGLKKPLTLTVNSGYIGSGPTLTLTVNGGFMGSVGYDPHVTLTVNLGHIGAGELVDLNVISGTIQPI